MIVLPDPLVTALLNNNGNLYVWSGQAAGGQRLSVYAGNDTVQELSNLNEGCPPYAGAVDAIGSRIYWGTSTTYPEASSSVFSYGSVDGRIPPALHNVIRTSKSTPGDNPNVSALRVVEQGGFDVPKLVVGWRDDTNPGLDKYSSSATLNSVWRSQLYNVGKKFTVREIRIPLAKAVAANMTLTPKVYVDDASSNYGTSNGMKVVNTTNYPNSEREIRLYPQGVSGKNNFFLEFSWDSTVPLPVEMPIRIKIDVHAE